MKRGTHTWVYKHLSQNTVATCLLCLLGLLPLRIWELWVWMAKTQAEAELFWKVKTWGIQGLMVWRVRWAIWCCTGGWGEREKQNDSHNAQRGSRPRGEGAWQRICTECGFCIVPSGIWGIILFLCPFQLFSRTAKFRQNIFVFSHNQRCKRRQQPTVCYLKVKRTAVLWQDNYPDTTHTRVTGGSPVSNPLTIEIKLMKQLILEV